MVPLGSGKTAFARALIRALLGQSAEEVPSPTFTLVQLYEHAAGAIWHFDLYRLDGPEDAYELGIEDAFAGAISLIEWPEKLGDHDARRLASGAVSYRARTKRRVSSRSRPHGARVAGR